MLAMLSGHYSVTYSHPQNGLVLILMMFAGAAIRQFFVMRHGYKLGRNGNPLPYALVGVAGVEGRNGYKEVKAVLAQRCYLCHGEQVQMKNVRLDSPQSVQTNAQNIYQQVVVTKLMPMNNSTGLTEPERLLIKQWFEAGANTQ
jgi:uncharacterized membrane protein